MWGDDSCPFRTKCESVDLARLLVILRRTVYNSRKRVFWNRSTSRRFPHEVHWPLPRIARSSRLPRAAVSGARARFPVGNRRPDPHTAVHERVLTPQVTRGSWRVPTDRVAHSFFPGRKQRTKERPGAPARKNEPIRKQREFPSASRAGGRWTTLPVVLRPRDCLSEASRGGGRRIRPRPRRRPSPRQSYVSCRHGRGSWIGCC